jgi:hypothetical protein
MGVGQGDGDHCLPGLTSVSVLSPTPEAGPLPWSGGPGEWGPRSLCVAGRAEGRLRRLRVAAPGATRGIAERSSRPAGVAGGAGRVARGGGRPHPCRSRSGGQCRRARVPERRRCHRPSPAGRRVAPRGRPGQRPLAGAEPHRPAGTGPDRDAQPRRRRRDRPLGFRHHGLPTAPDDPTVTRPPPRRATMEG